MPTKTFTNIASHLPLQAQVNPYKPAVIYPQCVDFAGRAAYTHYTLKQLDDASDRIAHALDDYGVRRGVRTVLMVKPSLDFFALTFALFKIGAIPVMIDPGVGVNNMGPSLDEAEPEAFIGIPKAQAARLLMGWGKKTIKKAVTVGRKMPFAGPTLSEIMKKSSSALGGKKYEMAQTTAGETAAILFTSGSTGPSKGAVYTHGNFDAQVRFLKDIYGIQPGEMDLATFPLFALFGPALGMASIIPDMDASHPADADPEKIFQAIGDFGPTNMFASPALINKLGRYAEENGIKVSSLKRVISAGAPASVRSIERFVRMLPEGVQVHTPYGATEALPLTSIGSDEILKETRMLTRQGKGNCVGAPHPDVEVKIIKIIDEPIEKWRADLELKQGEIGEIVVKGPVVTESYYSREDSTKKAKIPDPDNGGFYHRMGDTGYFDEKGRLWFCGRKSHRVVIEDETLFTIPTEAVFNCRPDVFRSAVVGVEKEGGTVPVLCVELEQGVPDSDKARIEEDLQKTAKSYPHTRAIKTILFHSGFPVDVRHNAKIFREKLAVWAKGVLR